MAPLPLKVEHGIEADSFSLPSALLQPAWETEGATDEQPAAQAFDTPVGPTSGFTLCARVRRNAGEEARGAILRKGEPPAGWLFEAPSAVGGVIAFASGARATSTMPESAEEGAEESAAAAEQPPRGDSDVGSTRLDDGAWHHVAVSYSKGQLRAFVDGRLDGEASIEVAAAPDDSLILGVSEEGGATGSDLRDVQAYLEPLSDAQVAGLSSGSKDLPIGISLVLFPKQVSAYWRHRVEGNTDGAQTVISEALELGKDVGRVFQDKVILALFEDFLEHARQNCLTPRKAAVFMAILNATLKSMYRTSANAACTDETYSVSECFAEYKRLIFAHSFAAAAQAPTVNIGVFTVPEVRELTDFMTANLFQQYILYRSVIVCPMEAVTKHAQVALDLPRVPPDLRKAKPRAEVKSKKKGAKTGATDPGIANEDPTAAAAPRDSPTSEQGIAVAADAAPSPDAADAGPLVVDGENLSVDEYHARAAAAAEARIQASIDRRDIP